ncbi:MAG: SAM-dependent methyltransferase [Bacteroidetes bacterium MedPE-SWsnd-G2]|nr:MAG: SAM-dependent methyltransferase [Bacteroidetes bacterium MedPE-SWsnd-G2]
MDSKTEGTNKKKPWPTKAAMTQVYELNLWGGSDTDFYSGEGSHLPSIVNPYIEALTLWLKRFENAISLCDLGCGDFNIGRQLVPYTNQYIGIDIVSELIKRNKEKFKIVGLEFQCKDISKSNLPDADCVVLRQVLQHLSNTEVQEVSEKLRNYKYVILTEHVPNGEFIPNLDIISGQGIRLKKKSGIDLLAAPFNLVIKSKERLHRVDLGPNKGVIETHCYTMF